ncbi:3-oxoacyl-acp reductase [hydrocarbon metagenome]|uniref:3-oxoacyl-acp reductase n=1 Tax=hydrocarbon metagenome TaxID=938273 RepID=A0A0W8E5M5_9ZZZZ
MKERTAIITGSSRGIGKAIALELAREGYRVAVNYHISREGALEEAREVLAQIESAGGKAIIVGADVATPEGSQQLVDETLAAFGQVDVLVNNVGVNKDQLMLRISDEEWKLVIDTNLNSAFYCSRAALKTMVRKRYGRIINISSVVGITGNAGQAHYAAAKSGLLGFTYSIAREYGRRGITANVIAPGYIKSDMTAALNEEQTARIAEGIAVGRLGTPEDIAGVAAFLASDKAEYINAQVIRVDGGLASM